MVANRAGSCSGVGGRADNSSGMGGQWAQWRPSWTSAEARLSGCSGVREGEEQGREVRGERRQRQPTREGSGSNKLGAVFEWPDQNHTVVKRRRRGTLRCERAWYRFRLLRDCPAFYLFLNNQI